MSIVEDVCKKQGHQLKSLRINDSMVPVQPGTQPSEYLVVARFDIRCAACGQTLEQVIHKKASGPSGKKKPKIKVGETNEHSGVSAAPQEESNHSNPEPLPSPYSDMP